MQETMPVMQDNLSNVTPRLVTYTRKGTEISQLRFYAANTVDGVTKQKQVRNADVYDHLNNSFSLEGEPAETTAAEVDAAAATSSPIEAQAQTLEDAPVDTATVVALGGAAVNRRGFCARAKDLKDRVGSGFDSLRLKTRTKVAAVALLAAGIVVSALAVTGESPAYATASPQGITAAAPNGGHGNAPRPETDLEKEKQQYDHDQALKVAAEVAAETQRVSLEAAITEGLATATSALAPNQFEQITNSDQILLDPAELNERSINHGIGWDGDPATADEYVRSLNGADKMGADILSARGRYTAVDARIAREALASKGVPANIIDQIANNNYDGIMTRGYMVKAKNVTYMNIAYQGDDANGNRVLAFDSSRTVGVNDTFKVVAYPKGDGTFGNYVARVDCSGNLQVFDSLSIPVPAAPKRTVSTPHRTRVSTPQTRRPVTNPPTRPPRPPKNPPTRPPKNPPTAGPKQNPHAPAGGRNENVEAPVAGPSTPVIVKNPNTGPSTPPPNVIPGTPPNLPPGGNQPARP